MLQHLTFHYLPLSILLLFLQRYTCGKLSPNPLFLTRVDGIWGHFFVFLLYCSVLFHSKDCGYAVKLKSNKLTNGILTVSIKVQLKRFWIQDLLWESDLTSGGGMC